MQNKNAPVAAVWDPLEPYDTLKPNDYNEYKLWKQRDRVERASERAAERKRAREALDRGSDHTGSDSEGQRPKKSGVQTNPGYVARFNFWFQGDLTTGLSISGLAQMTNVPVGLVPPTLRQFMWIAICQGRRPFSGDLQCLLVPPLECRHRLLYLLIITYRVRKPISAALPWPREVTARTCSLHPLPLSVNHRRAAAMTSHQASHLLP